MIQTTVTPPHKIVLLSLLFGILPGCAFWSHDIEVPPTPLPTVERLETHSFYLEGENSVVGRLASVPIEEGDTLSDVARHFGLGYQHIVEANPNLDPWVPQTGSRAILPLQFILPKTKHQGVVINLAAMRLFYFAGGSKTPFSTWPVGIGREGRSTPVGGMIVERKMEHPTWFVPDSIRKTHAQQGDPLPSVVRPGPDNPLGDYALYLSKPSYLIHGTNKPYSIGLRASNGCIRLYPEDIEQVFQQVPQKVPVQIVNQPYLLGWLDGLLFLEAHQPFEELDARQQKKNLMAELQRIAKNHPRKLDWPKIEETLKQARGIPIPVFEQTESLEQQLASAKPLKRPARLIEQPENLAQGKESWFIRTVEADDEYRAKRLAAQLNHLGPRIPAKVVSENHGYHVIAGPFFQDKIAMKVQLTLITDFDVKTKLEKQPGN